MDRPTKLWVPLLLGLLTFVAPGNAAEQTPGQIASVVSTVSPAVVRVIAVRPPTPQTDGADTKLASASAEQTTTAIGSGFIIDPSGFVATNKHVINDATAVFVMTADGVRHVASLVGTPSKADMALLRIHADHPLPSVRFGDSDKIKVGDTVVAIGSPFGFDNSASSGIISAMNRDIMESPFDDYLQTDAAINHGNSGGPLFDLEGEVVGMTSVIFAPGTGSVGLGFALPSNDLRFVFDRLMKTGAIRAGMLPIHTQQVNWMLKQALATPGLQGALVSSVQDDTGAMLHGSIKPGDVILTFNGQPVSDPRDLARKAAKVDPGSDAALGVSRNGATEQVHVTIQQWPESKPNTLKADSQQTLGLHLLRAEQSSVTVGSVDPAGTAADSGIQKGDIICDVQQTAVKDPNQALQLLSAKSSRDRGFAAVRVERDKKFLWIPLAIPRS